MYWSEDPLAIQATTEVPVLIGKTAGQNRPLRAMALPLDVEALAAAALAFGFGILKLERFVESLLDEVDQGAVD